LRKQEWSESQQAQKMWQGLSLQFGRLPANKNLHTVMSPLVQGMHDEGKLCELRIELQTRGTAILWLSPMLGLPEFVGFDRQFEDQLEVTRTDS
jgi:hypothetical protein